MIFNMSGGGGAAGAGSGVGLNFKIIGGTAQPSNPAENTIWVNTENEITGWGVSSKEPENPIEGYVWIQTSDGGAVTFNALKKNRIQVYPSFVKQYISGLWVSRDALVYMNDDWCGLEVYLFNNGDQNTSVTGGWSKDAENGFTISPYVGNTRGSQDITETMNITWTSASSSYNAAAFYATTNQIDLTNISYIVATLTATGYLSQSKLGVMTGKEPFANGGDWGGCTAIASVVDGTTILDVSALTGSYHIVIGGQSNGTGSGKTGTLNIREIVIK